jgi:hypothetical protein
MRRVLLLLALVALVIWLAHATPRATKGELRPGWFYSRAAAAPAPASASAVTPSAVCGECSPNDEADCIFNGGSWDPNTCECAYGCDPNLELQCYYSGGTWDSYFCSCDYPQCNPGWPEVVDVIEVQYQYCDGWEVWDCEGSWTDYAVYCQDGSLYDSWTEYTEVCASTGDPCGDGGCDWWDPWCECDWWYCS